LCHFGKGHHEHRTTRYLALSTPGAVRQMLAQTGYLAWQHDRYSQKHLTAFTYVKADSAYSCRFYICKTDVSYPELTHLYPKKLIGVVVRMVTFSRYLGKAEKARAPRT